MKLFPTLVASILILLSLGTASAAVATELSVNGIEPGATIRVSTVVSFSWAERTLNLERSELQFSNSSDSGSFLEGDGSGPNSYRRTIDPSVELRPLFLTGGVWHWRICEFEYFKVLPAACSHPVSFNVLPPGECEDGIDNDGDGKTDLRDLACRSYASPKERLAKIPRFSVRQAKREARRILRRSTRLGYRAGYGWRERCKVVARTRAVCSSSWNVGDSDVRVRIRLRRKWCRGNDVCLEFRYRAVVANYYCMIVGGEKCVRIFRK